MSADSDYEAYRSESPLPSEGRRYLKYLHDPSMQKLKQRRIFHDDSGISFANPQRGALSDADDKP